MRTSFEFVLSGAPEGLLRDAGRAALAEIEDAEGALSLFRRDSLLAHINRTAAREPVRVDADTMGLLLVCRDVWRGSEGLFDPTVAPLMTAMGLHEGAEIPEEVRGHAQVRRPPAAGVGSVSPVGEGAMCSPAIGFDAVELDEAGSSVRFSRPLALDLGGVAKGFALDRAAGVLRDAGVPIALLHGGTSSVVALGPPPGRAGWDVRLRAAAGLSATGDGAAARSASIVTLCRNALGVSAHAGRRVMHAGAAAGHIIDPRTRRSAEERCALAAVVAPTGALADAWSTAALVAGGRPAGMPASMRCITA